MKTKEIAISKSQQRRIAIQSEPQGKKGERPPKNPRVPIFPPQTVPLVNLLNQVIDQELNGDQERRALAYGILSRLCVVHAPPIIREGHLVVQVELTHYDELAPAEARGRLTTSNTPVINDLVTLMARMFPNGEGLPEVPGAGPL